MRLQRRGITMVEAVMAVLLVGVTLVAALDALGSSRRSQLSIDQRGRGQALAEQLMAEVRAKAYADPERDPAAGAMHRTGLGPDSGETGRSQWDDVDDFDTFFETPPRNADGSAILGADDWQRLVTVKLVDPDDVSSRVDYDEGSKIIEVLAIRHGKVHAKVSAAATTSSGQLGLCIIDGSPGFDTTEAHCTQLGGTWLGASASAVHERVPEAPAPVSVPVIADVGTIFRSGVRTRIDAPDGAQPGDLILAAFSTTSSGEFVPRDEGWFEVTSYDGLWINLFVFGLVIPEGEDSWIFDIEDHGSGSFITRMHIQNAAIANPVSSPATRGRLADKIWAPGADADKDNSLVLRFVAGSLSQPSPTSNNGTIVHNDSRTSPPLTMVVVDDGITSAGSVGETCVDVTNWMSLAAATIVISPKESN
ncbi:MAG: hypothetical protein AAF747_00830 [Planctomycetota bacterium]